MKKQLHCGMVPSNLPVFLNKPFTKHTANPNVQCTPFHLQSSNNSVPQRTGLSLKHTKITKKKPKKPWRAGTNSEFPNISCLCSPKVTLVHLQTSQYPEMRWKPQKKLAQGRRCWCKPEKGCQTLPCQVHPFSSTFSPGLMSKINP